MRIIVLLAFFLAAARLSAADPAIQPFNGDLEIARVRRELAQIRALPISNEAKAQKQRAVLDREKLKAMQRQGEIERLEAQEEKAKENTEGGRARKKAIKDSLQKFLDTLSSIDPKL